MLVATKKPHRRPAPKLKDLVTGKPLRSLHLTEAEFVDWAGEKVRAEWVDGKVELMSPVSVDHDQLTGWIYGLLRWITDTDSIGRIFASEVMVRLPEQSRRRLPDLKFVAQERLDIVQKNCIEGAPDLIVEVVSPDSVARDYRDKYQDYLAAGVREYWIVDPLSQSVEVHVLKGKKYVPLVEIDGVVTSTVIPQFKLRPAGLWKQPLPSLAKSLKEMGIKL